MFNFISQKTIAFTGIGDFDKIQQLKSLCYFKLNGMLPSEFLSILYAFGTILLLCPLTQYRALAIYGFLVPAFRTVSSINYRDCDAEEQLIIYWITYCLFLYLEQYVPLINYLIRAAILISLYNQKRFTAIKLYKYLSSRYGETLFKEVSRRIDQFGFYLTSMDEQLKKQIEEGNQFQKVNNDLKRD